MRLVLDTNAAISGLLWGGNPGQLIALSCALSAGVDLIVPGDAHLLDLKRFQGIEIVSPAQAVIRIAI